MIIYPNLCAVIYSQEGFQIPFRVIFLNAKRNCFGSGPGLIHSQFINLVARSLSIKSLSIEI